MERTRSGRVESWHDVAPRFAFCWLSGPAAILLRRHCHNRPLSLAGGARDVGLHRGRLDVSRQRSFSLVPPMRYHLRVLLIVLAIGPMVLAGMWFAGGFAINAYRARVDNFATPAIRRNFPAAVRGPHIMPRENRP